MRLYLDANAIIYGVEGIEALRSLVLDWIDRVEAQEDGFLLTSELSLLECLVKPTRDGDEKTIQKFGAFFDREHLVLLEVTRPVLARAVEIRRNTGSTRRTPSNSQRRSSMTPTPSSRPTARWRSLTKSPFTF